MLLFFLARKLCKVNNIRELNTALQNLVGKPLAPPLCVWLHGECREWDPGKKNLFPVCLFFRMRSRVAQGGFYVFCRSMFAAFIELSWGWGTGERSHCGRLGAPAISLPQQRSGTGQHRGGPAPQPGPPAGGPRHRAHPAAPRLDAAPPACPGSLPRRHRAPGG